MNQIEDVSCIVLARNLKSGVENPAATFKGAVTVCDDKGSDFDFVLGGGPQFENLQKVQKVKEGASFVSRYTIGGQISRDQYFREKPKTVLRISELAAVPVLGKQDGGNGSGGDSTNGFEADMLDTRYKMTFFRLEEPRTANHIQKWNWETLGGKFRPSKAPPHFVEAVNNAKDYIFAVQLPHSTSGDWLVKEAKGIAELGCPTHSLRGGFHVGGRHPYAVAPFDSLEQAFRELEGDLKDLHKIFEEVICMAVARVQ